MKRLIYFSLFILTFPCVVSSDPKFNKEWQWDLSGDEYVYAATVNSDGRTLGQYCYFSYNLCVYLVSLGTNCEVGSEYPSILNSNKGVGEVSLVCGPKTNGENVFYIRPFDEVDNLIGQADTVGFAIATEDGFFKAVRFNLSGSTYAIEKMRRDYILRNESESKGKQKIKSEEYL